MREEAHTHYRFNMITPVYELLAKFTNALSDILPVEALTDGAIDSATHGDDGCVPHTRQEADDG